MTFNGIIQIAVFCAIVIALTRPVGGFLKRVFAGERTWLSPVLRPVESVLYRLAGVEAEAEQTWYGYGLAMLLFNLVFALLLYFMLRFQDVLPLNPQHFPGLSPDLALNTAVSFVTNTNWQSYGGETTMSNFSQMVGLTSHMFVSAATGLALAIALIRGFARRSAKTLGNFWVDVTRCTLYVLLPMTIVVALFLVWQGVPQTMSGFIDVSTLEGAKQTLAIGPVASMEAIKLLGTNGGGFFNTNSAHPFENPTALTDFVQMLSIFVLGAAMTNVFGRMVGNERQGWAVFGVMGILFLAGLFTIYPVEAAGNPHFASLGINQAAGPMQAGGNMEGKEVRFGILQSSLFATVTTDASCGAVNAMHDSFMPLAGMIPMINMQLGEIIFGGVGSGLYGMLLFAIIAVFIAGLMVGRTPEYLGKKIEAKEVKMAILAILVLPLSILGFTAISSIAAPGVAGIENAGPHGFSEMLYAYTSATANNGSAFGGLSANTIFWNVTLAIAMFVGRFLFIVPMLAVAGSLGAKKLVPPSAGTFPTDNGLFVGLLTGVVLIVGGLTFFPALALGPVVEHFSLYAGSLF
ncbi:MAG TPA: potassium-transporting ATPase subunit KdpA [Stellaceae bacterium]|nr:potassium-transporting ATPase subunit KdpA [Stellaceae bacterium]